MMAKFAEDDRIEQLNAQKRRMKQAEHAREVAKMVEDRRKLYEEQKAREEAESAAYAAEMARRAAIIEEERKKLLQEAAEVSAMLVGWLVSCVPDQCAELVGGWCGVTVMDREREEAAAGGRRGECCSCCWW